MTLWIMRQEKLDNRLEVPRVHRLDLELPEGRPDAGGEVDRALEEGVWEASEVTRPNLSPILAYNVAQAQCP
jgi:hypothetical protein